MAAQRSGKIVNIGSIVGKLTMPFGGIYSATKAAVELYTDGLRVEIKPFGIQTMLVRPGAVRSAIASHGYYIKEEGIFSPFKACIHKRSQISQASPSTTPANVFAKGVVDAIVRKNMPLSYTAGDKSWLVVFFLARLPKFIQDWLASKIFGLSQVVLPAAPSSNKQIKSE